MAKDKNGGEPQNSPAKGSSPKGNHKKVEELAHVSIRFSGDSGDGMQLTGNQFTAASAMLGEEVSTLPDYPAEIRAPAGTVAGVSGFQMSFGEENVFTPGDKVDLLVAMNPAALKADIKLLKNRGILIVNEDTFAPKDLAKAGYDQNPLTGHTLDRYLVHKIKITSVTEEALKDLGLSKKEVSRCKNFFALGLTFWMFNRPMDNTIEWISKKFKKKELIAEANIRALKAGYNYGNITEIFSTSYVVRKKGLKKRQGTYRNITGNTAMALGLATAAHQADLRLFLGSYPITPASEILHELSKLKQYGVMTFQAEDEIAAIGSAIGASYGGNLAVTTTSGPGLALKSEFIGLAVITELPLVIVNVQRAGPSTGLPTKSEQSDLLQAMYGRNGESPLVVMAARSSRDCFYTALEAARIALHYMTPVIVLSDSYIANGAEAWRIPDADELPPIIPHFPRESQEFHPYGRDPETLARPWATPGMAGYVHRIGGLEKEDISGNVSHDPANHEHMVRLRQEKVEKVAEKIPPLRIHGNEHGKLLVVGWGSTYGVIRQAVSGLAEKGVPVACTHLRYLNPLPRDLDGIMNSYEQVLVVEQNLGQLNGILRSRFLRDYHSLNKVQGMPFLIEEIEHKVMEILG